MCESVAIHTYAHERAHTHENSRACVVRCVLERTRTLCIVHDQVDCVFVDAPLWVPLRAPHERIAAGIIKHDFNR